MKNHTKPTAIVTATSIVRAIAPAQLSNVVGGGTTAKTSEPSVMNNPLYSAAGTAGTNPLYKA